MIFAKRDIFMEESYQRKHGSW